MEDTDGPANLHCGNAFIQANTCIATVNRVEDGVNVKVTGRAMGRDR